MSGIKASIRFWVLFWVATQLGLYAQTFTPLVNFPYASGPGPQQLVQGLDGNLWGVTLNGGVYGCGTIFKTDLAGALMTEFDFNCTGPDPADPSGGLALAPSGLLYGTTIYGGPNDEGTFFSFQPGKPGTLNTLGPGFTGNRGVAPSGVVRAFNGAFYGTTPTGGANNDGALFEATAGGNMSVIYSFSAVDPGPATAFASLVQGGNGNFYGTTEVGGKNSGGSVFMVTPTAPGTLTTLYSFSGPDGMAPLAGFVLGSNGNFYGTTYQGGAYGFGTVFRITPAGKLTTLHNFRGPSPDGVGGCSPDTPLVQASDGNFYGTTSACGANGVGTIFRITPSGSFATLYSFDPTIPQHAATETGGLMQATDGNFYGAFEFGGQYGGGIVYRFSAGLVPFVKTLPGFGKVGSTIEILGTDLTGATGVTFNATPAAFSVKSAGLITAVVPTGATSGMIQVTTPSGTLQSNVAFHVY